MKEILKLTLGKTIKEIRFEEWFVCIMFEDDTFLTISDPFEHKILVEDECIDDWILGDTKELKK